MSASTFADALQVEVATLQAQHPILAGALDRAYTLLAEGGVFPLDDGRTAHVRSQSDPTVSHLVNGTCDCPATQYHAAPCAHRLAFRVYQRTVERLTVNPEDERWEPVAGPAAPAPLPEARCSINVRVVVYGHDVQVTLRGDEEAEVLQRLDAVLQRFPLEAPALLHTPTAPPPPVCQWHGTMKESTKATGTWYCPAKMADGSYCQERRPANGR